MKIKQDLPQFKNERALIISTGDQSGVLFYAHKGEIEKIEELKEELPQYSDKAGSFMTRVKQGLSTFSTIGGAGVTYERKEEKAQEEFLRMLKSAVKHTVHERDISTIYVFAPDYFEPQIVDSLETAHQNMITFVFHGTYTKEHPFTLLKKIDGVHEGIQEELRDQADMSEDARKLLKKGQEDGGRTAPTKREEQVRQFMERGRK